MKLIKDTFFHSPIKYAILFVIACIIVLINGFIKGFDFLIVYIDGFFIAGISMILVGGLSLLNFFGAYDFWSYTFSKRNPNGTKKPLYEYSIERKEKRNRGNLPFGPYFIVGLLFLIISIILFFLI
jgi:hypothetical protein